ncbi:MAG: DMT family transporter, partial [Chloroflexi bacterium]|nr:DMT family transporter [Chloroflexota bacterium]
VALVGLLSLALAVGTEVVPIEIGAEIWGAALFTGLLATALAYLVQTHAQRSTAPTHTALILVSEPVFAALFGYLLAGERLGWRQLWGCLLILLGMMVGEIPRLKRFKS